MEKMGATQAKKVIKEGAGETAPLKGNGFFAVANGAKPGIYPFYRYVLQASTAEETMEAYEYQRQRRC